MFEGTVILICMLGRAHSYKERIYFSISVEPRGQWRTRSTTHAVHSAEAGHEIQPSSSECLCKAPPRWESGQLIHVF